MAELVKSGDSVTVDYVGSLRNGKVFDTSIRAEAEKAGMPPRPSYSPLEFKVGSGQVIQGFDNALVGMKIGDAKTIEIPPEQGYGLKDEKLILTIPLAQMEANNIKPKVGLTLFAQNGSQGEIIEVNSKNAIVDFNFPLAGKVLVFKIILKKIN